MEVMETKWQSVDSAVRSAHLLHLQSRLIRTSGLSLAAASSGLTTLVLFRKCLLIHLASLLSQKQRNKKTFSAALLFPLTKLMSNCSEKKWRWQFPSQPPLTEKQRVTQEAFPTREDISISPLTGFGKSWIKPSGTSQHVHSGKIL